jgi:hypothetical protein
MRTQQQYRLDSFYRVQAFLDTNAGVVGPLGSSEARRQLDVAVTQLKAHLDDQGTTTLEMAGQLGRQRMLITDLKIRHMRPIAVFARAKLRGVPDFAALSRPLVSQSPKQLVQLARAMATAAVPYVAALTAGGFPSDAIAQLGAAADAVQRAMSDRANSGVLRAGATKGVAEQLTLGREAVQMLNAVIGRAFAGNAAFLAAWHSARRVVAKSGVARGGSGASVPAPVAPSRAAGSQAA